MSDIPGLGDAAAGDLARWITAASPDGSLQLGDSEPASSAGETTDADVAEQPDEPADGVAVQSATSRRAKARKEA